jgi:hypothetical protein
MRVGPLLAAASLAALGCDYGGSEGSTPTVSGCGEFASAGVDTGAELEITAGEGVGAFFEYLDDGVWRVTTTCDTPVSGNECLWDVFVSVSGDGALGDFGGQGLEAGDAMGFEDNGVFHFLTVTTDDTDAMMIDATPGAPVVFEVYLDGYCASPYMFWIGDGAVHGGSPGNPLELVPSE